MSSVAQIRTFSFAGLALVRMLLLLAAGLFSPAIQAWGFSAILHASESRAWQFLNIGYDAVAHLDVGYDGSEKLTSAYDIAPLRAQTDNERRTGAKCASIVLFARLLAAKETQIVLQEGQ